jgi:hypothetical protein
MGKKEKKSKKEKKEVKEASINEQVSTVKAEKEKKEQRKKAKKEKKEKEDKYKEHSRKRKVEDSEPVKNGAWNDWAKASFDGDQARKDKFLKLMGGKKGADSKLLVTSTTSPGETAIDHESKITNRIQQQFEKSRELHQKLRQGNRGGLGC